MKDKKINNAASWLRQLFKQSLSKSEDSDVHIIDLHSLRIVSLVAFTFSLIASIAIVNFFYFSNIVDDAFHASLAFMVSNELILSFILFRVVGLKNFKRTFKDVAAIIKNKNKNN